MKLKNYFFIMLVGMLWSTGAMAGTVNINAADVAELVDSIHGIGHRLAQAIVNYRSQYDDFDSIDDLMGVSGIGIAIINANQGVIVVKDGRCKHRSMIHLTAKIAPRWKGCLQAPFLLVNHNAWSTQ